MKKLKLITIFKKNKEKFYFISTSILLVINASAFAINYNNKQSINITSDIQILDVKRNSIISTGKVILTQKTLKITADKVIITQINNKKEEKIINGYGNPVRFHYLQDNGKLVTGYASKVCYKLKEDIIVLSGSVYFKQLNNSITGDKIIYSIKKHKIKIYSRKDIRISAKIVPHKLQESDGVTFQKKVDY